MKGKKLQVIQAAEKLFLEKGYNDTSIQDVLDASGISKGTFYNYFSSKKELIIVIHESYVQRFNEERDVLLVGQDPTDLDIFCKQLEGYFRIRKSKQLHGLYEELLSNSEFDLRNLHIKSKLNTLAWIESRLVDIFGEEKRDYLFDNAILLHGQIIYLSNFSFAQPHMDIEINEIIKFCVSRLPLMVEISEKQKVQLVDYRKFISPNCVNKCNGESEKLLVKRNLDVLIEKAEKLGDENVQESLQFVKEEIAKEKLVRVYLVDNILSALSSNSVIKDEVELKSLREMIKK